MYSCIAGLQISCSDVCSNDVDGDFEVLIYIREKEEIIKKTLYTHLLYRQRHYGCLNVPTQFPSLHSKQILVGVTFDNFYADTDSDADSDIKNSSQHSRNVGKNCWSNQFDAKCHVFAVVEIKFLCYESWHKLDFGMEVCKLFVELVTCNCMIISVVLLFRNIIAKSCYFKLPKA